MQTTTPPSFDERLWPSPAGWLTVPAAAVMCGIVLWPVSRTAGLVAGVVGLLAAGAAAVAASSRVRVAGGELHAGPAHVPVALLRDPRPLDREATREALGPGLDARAYVCLRGWVRTAVRVEVADPADPTPYWLVSTRHPEALVAALAADDDAGRAQEARPAS